jgi:aldose 1-epimerase
MSGGPAHLWRGALIGLMWAAGVSGCRATTVSVSPYGNLPDGSRVSLYSLKTAAVEVQITDYGGRVVSIKTPDRAGRFAEITLGFDSLPEYLSNKSFFGALIGRYANRIAHGRFELEGQAYQLAINAGQSSLHGGNVGFDKRLWQSQRISRGVQLSYVSPDGEEGYPGTLTTVVRYTLVGNELRLDYRATSDRDTVVNLTNHTYFNLTGNPDQTILGSRLTIAADRFTPVDADRIPVGDLQSVKDTPFDFRSAHAIGERIDQQDVQLQRGGGYDHNWVLTKTPGTASLAATVFEPGSGRRMQVLTTQPGIQFYSGNNLDGSVVGKHGVRYPRRSGFCLETQHFPDSPNHPGFPSTELKAGKTFRSLTVYKFSALPDHG